MSLTSPTSTGPNSPAGGGGSSSSSSTAPPLLAARPVASILADLTAGSYRWREDARAPGFLELTPVVHVADLATVANAISSPPGGRTWMNSARVSASDIGVTESGYWHVSGDTVSTYDTNAATAPVCYFASSVPDEGWEITCFVKSPDATGGDERVGMVLTNTSNAELALLVIGYNGGANGYARIAGSGANFTITAQQVSDGMWLRFTGGGGVVRCWTNPAAYSVLGPPSTGWTLQRSGALAVNTPWRVGPTILRATGSGSITARYAYWDESHTNGYGQPYHQAAVMPCLGWTGSVAQPSITVVKDLQLSTAPTDAQLRAILAGACNRRKVDSAGLEVLARKASSAGGHSGGTWRTVGGGTEAWDGSGEYLEVKLRPASGFSTPASVNLAALGGYSA